MLLKPDLAHLPHPPLRRRGRPGGPAALRHLHPGRGAVRRLPPHHAQAPGGAGPEARLRHDGGVRGGVLPVREGGRRQPLRRSPTTPASYFDLGPLDKGEEIRRVIVEQLVEMGFEVEAAHHEVADGPARDRLQVRRRAHHRGQPHHLQVRGPQRRQPLRLHRVVHAQADRGHQRQRDAHAPVAVPRQGERVLRPEGEYQLSQGRAELHRGAAAARARLLRHHQPADQQLQAAGAGLRGAGQRRLVDAEPLAAGADPRPARAGHALRAPDAGSGVQSVPGAHGPARGRARRHRAEARRPGSR